MREGRAGRGLSGENRDTATASAPTLTPAPFWGAVLTSLSLPFDRAHP